jgi:uncharacterized protein YbjT (DUF2867 family)
MSGSQRRIMVTGATGLLRGVLVRPLADESGLQGGRPSEAAHRCSPKFLLLYVQGGSR